MAFLLTSRRSLDKLGRCFYDLCLAHRTQKGTQMNVKGRKLGHPHQLSTRPKFVLKSVLITTETRRVCHSQSTVSNKDAVVDCNVS